MTHVHVAAAKCSPAVHGAARLLGDGLSAGRYVGPTPPIASWRESKTSARVRNIEQRSMTVSGTKRVHFIDGKIARHHRRRLVKQPGCEIAGANEYPPHIAQQCRLKHRPSPDRVRDENFLRRSMPRARDAS